MTAYTERVAEFEGSAVLSLERARALTGLELVAAREILSYEGQSYHEMEEGSESKSHYAARQEGIDFFCSIGYRIFPEGVGIKGVFTFADFIAIRGNRLVFVEVLSDTNVKTETLKKKAQLQQYGELCFILFSGNKWSNEANLWEMKRRIESWADVLYCRLNSYTGNRIEQTSKATVVYDTTRQEGIKVALAFARSGRKLAVSVNFLTHLYQDSTALPRAYPAYPVGNLSYRYEQIFLEIFEELQSRIKGRIPFTSRHRTDAAIRSMRRKSGLRLIGSDGRVMARLKSEYRGVTIEEDYSWSYHPSSRGLPADDCFFVFLLDRLVPDGIRALILAMEEHGMVPVYSTGELEQNLKLLARRCRVEEGNRTVAANKH